MAVVLQGDALERQAGGGVPRLVPQLLAARAEAAARRRPRAGPQRLPGPVINNRPRSRLQSGCTTEPSSSPYCIFRRSRRHGSPGDCGHCARRHRLPFPAGREHTIPHRAHERVPPRPGQCGSPLRDQPESARANRPKARPSARHTRVVCSARRDLVSDHGDVLLLGWCSDLGRQMPPACPRNRTSSALCPQAAIANNDTSNTGRAFPFATHTRRCCRDRTHGTSFGGSALCSLEATFPTAPRATVAESSRVEDECGSSCAHRRAAGSRAHRQAALFLQRSHTNLRAGNRTNSIQRRRRLLVAP